MGGGGGGDGSSGIDLFDVSMCNETLDSLIPSLIPTFDIPVDIRVTVCDALYEKFEENEEAAAAAACTGEGFSGWTLSPHVGAFFIIVRAQWARAARDPLRRNPPPPPL